MELDLKEILLLLWQKIYLVIVCAIVGGIAAFCITYFFITPMYSATASLYVYNTNRTPTGITQSDLTVSQKLVDTYIVILKSDSVLEKVADKTGFGYSAKQIRGMISASATNGTEAFTVTVTNASAERAQTIANCIVDVVPDEIIRVVKAGSVEVIDRAKVPTAPSSPNRLRNTVLGVLLGIMLSVAFIIIVSMFDTTVHSESDLAEFDIPVLGVIPALEPEER